MELKHNLERLACDAVVKATDATMRNSVANFRWEQAISESRTNDYNEFMCDTESYKDWKAEHINYLRTSVHLAKDLPRSPECFTGNNGLAHISDNIDNTFLLRLESLGYLFDNPLYEPICSQFWSRFYHSPNDLLNPYLKGGAEELRAEFVAQWNSMRTESRPLFATFLNEFGGDIKKLAKSDWPHLLRDRLGLTHWPSTPGRQLPVALVCYSVDDVRRARELDAAKGATASFTRPTVLDAEMSAAFIPSPARDEGESYGYTLDLSHTNAIPPDSFTPELLTYPIEYHAGHIKALGFITKPHSLFGEPELLNARNLHVQGLQAFIGNENFGEVLE